MNIYPYNGDYFNFHVDGELGQEGMLTGRFGDLHFRRCRDGFAIIDSYMVGSGFISGPVSISMGFPGLINDIPVTEISQSVYIDNWAFPIAIDAPNLKRVYLNLFPESEKKIEEEHDLFLAFIEKLMSNEGGKKYISVSIDLYPVGHVLEYCEIQCYEKCILGHIDTKHLKVSARPVILSGKAYSGLEQAEFRGNVYPYVGRGWDGDEIDFTYFEENDKLRFVDGSLKGDQCWSFHNCTQLQKVHLSNGIIKVPSYCFANCTSLTDLYIPDTVTKIGEYAFMNCYNLKTIHLPSGIRVIPKGAFRNCRSLLKCFLSDSIEVIEDEAFSGCDSMKKPWIPKAIQNISPTAFDHPEWYNF